MSVVGGQQLPGENGKRDAIHHRERVKKEVNDYLKKNLGEKDIISSGQEGKIKVPIKKRQRYHFIYDRNDSQGVGQGDVKDGDSLGPAEQANGQQPDQAGLEPGEELIEVWLDMKEVEALIFEQLQLPRLQEKAMADISDTKYVFDDLALKGSLLDKKATLKKNLQRNASSGGIKVGNFQKEDLRYLSYREHPKPKSKAVVFMAMDVSASFGDHHKQIARLFFYWIVSFLRYKYDQVELEFIVHHTLAKRVSEHEFFNTKESGGTMASSAYKCAEELMSSHYPSSEYNLYFIHVSDGDNYGNDNAKVWSHIENMCQTCNLVGYLEVRSPAPIYGIMQGQLGRYFEKQEPVEGFLAASANEESEIWPAIQHMFSKEDVANAIQNKTKAQEVTP